MGFDVEIDAYDGLDIEETAQEALFETAVEAQNRYAENVQRGRGDDGTLPGGFVDRGEAINAITISPQDDGARTYTVGGDAIQLLIAEFGRAPNNTMPPKEPIEEWAQRNGLTPEDGDWDSMIFAIRQTIAEEGIAGFAPARLTASQMEGRLQVRATQKLQAQLDDETE